MTANKRRTLISTALIVVAIALLYPIYNTPLWWVSLNAPNYPEESFPKGVRIQFHANGVFNGCDQITRAEIQAEETLDCVHEMDTINHYVGMYPIAAGGPVELVFSLFLVAFVVVLLVGFLFTKTVVRMGVLIAGFLFVAIWMGVTWYGSGGIKYHNGDYIAGRITVLGQESEQEEEAKPLTAGEEIIARLKASLEEDPAGNESKQEKPAESDGQKTRDIAYLKSAFTESQNRATGGGEQWKGSAVQLLAWHYRTSLGRYFNDQAVIGPMVSRMTTAGNITFWAILIVIAVLIAGAFKTRGLFHWLLILLPMTLPLIFVIEYAAWLWWYGHNMSVMGAFTLKPFMPTVFGQGKVAQFSTNSYPHIGFWLMVIFSLLLGAAALLRRQQTHNEDTGADV